MAVMCILQAMVVNMLHVGQMSVGARTHHCILAVVWVVVVVVMGVGTWEVAVLDHITKLISRGNYCEAAKIFKFIFFAEASSGNILLL